METNMDLSKMYDFSIDIQKEYGFNENDTIDNNTVTERRVINWISRLSSDTALSLHDISVLTGKNHTALILDFLPFEKDNFNWKGAQISSLYNFPGFNGDQIYTFDEKHGLKDHSGYIRIYEQFAGCKTTKEETFIFMVDFLKKTIDKIIKYYDSENKWNDRNLDKFTVLFKNYEKWFVFQKNFGVIDKESYSSTKSGVERNDESDDWILNQIYKKWEEKAKTGKEKACEMLARLILTVSMFYLLHPAKNELDEYQFKARVKCYYDPSLALNVLWTYDFSKKQFFYLAKDNFESSDIDKDESTIAKLMAADGHYENKDYKSFFNVLIKEFSSPSMMSSVYELNGTRKLITSAMELIQNDAVSLDINFDLMSVINKYSAVCPGEGHYYEYRYYLNIGNSIDLAYINLMTSCENLYEPAIFCLLDAAEGKGFTDLVTAESFSKDKVREVCLKVSKSDKKTDRELLKRVYFFLGKESSSPNEKEKYLKLAKQNGHSEAEEKLNSQRYSGKHRKADKKTFVDFCLVNSNNGCTDILRDSMDCKQFALIGDNGPEKNDIKEFIKKLETSDSAKMIVGLFNDDENRNIADAIKMIRTLSDFNNNTNSIKAEKRVLIKELCEKLKKLGFGENSDTESFIRMINSEENYALGQFRFVNGLRNENDSDERKEIIGKLEEAFSLPESTKKLMDSVGIFIRTNNPEYAASVIDAEMSYLTDGLYFRVKYIDPAKEAVHKLLTDIPVFAPAYDLDPEDNPHLVIFGSSRAAEKMITETLACTYMGAIRPTITLIDGETSVIKEKIAAGCPAFEDEQSMGIPKPEFFDISLNSPELHKMLSGDGVGSENYQKVAFNLRRGNYFVVATDDEKFNIYFAAKLRGLLLMTDNKFTRLPVIAVYTPTSCGELACENFEVGNQNGYSWYSNYNLRSFGKIEDCYSAEMLINDPIQTITEKIHSVYSNIDLEKMNDKVKGTAKHEMLRDLYTKYYNYDSSNCAAISLPYRLFARNLKLDDIYDYCKDDAQEKLAVLAEGFTSGIDLESIAMLEHQRWLGFMTSRTWRYAAPDVYGAYMSRGVNKQQLFICKLHPYMCGWDDLEKIHENLLKRLEGNSYALSKLRSNPKEIDKDSIINTAYFLRAGFKKDRLLNAAEKGE